MQSLASVRTNLTQTDPDRGPLAVRASVVGAHLAFGVHLRQRAEGSRARREPQPSEADVVLVAGEIQLRCGQPRSDRGETARR